MPLCVLTPEVLTTGLGYDLLLMRATLVLLMLLGACALAPASLGTTRASSSRCGSPITRNGARGPVVGPVQFRGLRRAEVPLGSKVLILQATSRTPVTIRGSRCAGGTPMRFLFDKPLPQTLTPTTGTTALALRGAAGDAFIGYILWSKPGDWRLTVSRGGRRLGSVVFCVAQSEQVTSPCSA